MRRRQAHVPLVAVLTVAATLLCAESARADVLGLHADGYAGYSNYSKAGGGATLGVDALARLAFFQAGLVVDSTAGAGTAGNGNETVQTYGLMAGLAFYGKRLGWDFLVVGGAHAYEHVSQSLETGGVNATAPFLQGRVGLNLLTLRPLSLGLWGFAGDDLTRSNKSFSVANRAPGGGLLIDNASIGESSWGVAFRIGIDFGI
jgi:hypothetical protein